MKVRFLPTTLLGAGLLGVLAWLSPLPPPRSPARPAPTLLVLGASQVGGRPSSAFRRRLDHALTLYRQGGVRRIIVSGGVGQGQHISEGATGVRYLRGRGVPGTALRAEERSRTTFQNLEFSRPLIGGPVTLVTDAVHARRALSLARAAGLRAEVSSVALKPTPHYLLRETLALLAWRCLRYTGGRDQPRPQA
ncbi:YdcF family protein [Deinococcus irradiatisoli]|uniref:YdcF family protein n=1 Tax=Deinococcus irradiatisoli TaxID=2202254 RepID=A0A2Z3JEE5_9DEIO|nr:YdcF family protein [Deinococcus irradiatisoli]AWN23533.1 YdcF family protein [Deinococcus irradiatisoli]